MITNISSSRTYLIEAKRYSTEDGMMVVTVVCFRCRAKFENGYVDAMDKTASGVKLLCIRCDPDADR